MKVLLTIESLNKRVKEKIKKGVQVCTIPFFSNYVVTAGGEIYSIRGKRILSRCKNRSDRQRIDLVNDAGETKTVHVAQLIFSAFANVRYDLISQLGHIDHVDNNRTNDSILNLQVLDGATNIKKYHEHRRLIKNLKTKEELAKRFEQLKLVA